MTIFKVTGYVDVPDEDVTEDQQGVTSDGYSEIRAMQVGDLDDVEVTRADA